MTGKPIRITITTDAKGAISGIRTTSKHLSLMGKAAKGATHSIGSFKNMAVGLGAVGLGTMMYGIGQGFAVAAKSAWDTRAAMETAELSFRTIYGSAEKANVALKGAKELVGTFDITTIINFERRLAGAGIKAGQLKGITQGLLGTTAAYGLNLDQTNRTMNAFGQMLSKGKIQAEEVTQQLAETGIPVMKILAKQMGKTKAQVADLMKKGKLGTDVVLDLFKQLRSMYGDTMWEKLKTLPGRMEAFKNSAKFGLMDAFDPIFDVIYKRLPGATKTFGKVLTALRPQFQVLGKVVDLAFDAFDGLPKKIIEFNKWLGLADGKGKSIFKTAKSISDVSFANWLQRAPEDSIGGWLRGEGWVKVEEQFKKGKKIAPKLSIDWDAVVKTLEEGKQAIIDSVSTFFADSVGKGVDLLIQNGPLIARVAAALSEIFVEAYRLSMIKAGESITNAIPGGSYLQDLLTTSVIPKSDAYKEVEAAGGMLGSSFVEGTTSTIDIDGKLKVGQSVSQLGSVFAADSKITAAEMATTIGATTEQVVAAWGGLTEKTVAELTKGGTSWSATTKAAVEKAAAELKPEKVVTPMDTIGKQLGASGLRAAGELNKSLSKGMSGAAGTARQGAGRVGAAVGKVPSLLKAAAGPAGMAAGSIGTSATKGLIGGARGINPAARKSVAGVPGQIGSQIGPSGGAGGRLGMSVVTGISKGIAPAGTAGKAVATSARTGAESQEGTLSSAGSNMISGLVGGIRSMAASAASAAAAVASGAAAAARAALKIHSPSRVFIEIGEYVIDGFIIGLTGGVEDVKSTMLGLSKIVMDLKTSFKENLAEANADRRDALDKLKEARKELQNARNADITASKKNKAAYRRAVESHNEAVREAKRTLNKALREYKGSVRELNEIMKLKSTIGNSKFMNKLEDRMVNWSKRLTKLAQQREAVAVKLEDAKQKLEEAIALRDDFAKSTSDAAKATGALTELLSKDAEGENKPANIADFKKNLAQKISAIKTFTRRIAALNAQGLNDAMLKQILDMGPEAGMEYANAILAGGATGISDLNVLQGDLETASDKLGKLGGRVLYQSGVDSANELVNGLQDQYDSLTAASESLAKAMIAAFRKSFKLGKVMDDEVRDWFAKFEEDNAKKKRKSGGGTDTSAPAVLGGGAAKPVVVEAGVVAPHSQARSILKQLQALARDEGALKLDIRGI